VIGRLTAANTHYQNAKDIADSSSNQDDAVLAVIFQQLCIYSSGKNDEPLDKLRALAVNIDTLSVKTKGTLHQAMGNIYRSAADFHNAKIQFKESIKLAKEEADEHKIMERKAELGRVYRSSGCYTKALKHQENFFRYSLNRGSVSHTGAACGYIGFTYFSMGRDYYDQSVKYLYCKLRLSKKELDDISGYRWCLNNIGKVYLALNDYEVAIKHFTESSEIAKEIGNTLGLGTAYGNLGSAYRAIGKHDEAIKYHKLYLEIAQNNFDTGGVAIMQNELVLDHLYLYEKQVDQKDKISLLQTARKYGFQALKTGLEVRSRLKKDDDVLKIGNFEKNQAKTYSLLQFTLVKEGLREISFLVSELGRAQALADLVREKVKLSSNLLINEIINIVDELGNFIPDKVASVMTTLSSLLRQVNSRLLVYSIINDPLVVSQNLLYIWFISPSDPNVSISFHQSTLTKANIDMTSSSGVYDENYFTSFMRDIRSKSSQSHDSRDIVPKKPTSKEKKNPERNKLKELYLLLIHPVLGNIIQSNNEDIIRLIIVPQGILFNIPFAALQCPDFYLIEKFIVSLLPSVFLLQLALEKKFAQTGCRPLKVLAIGNPTMPLKEIDQLPGSEKEVKSLLSIIDGMAMVGDEANKNDVVKVLPNFPILHFATHAIIEDSLADHLNEVPINAIGDYSVKGAIVLAKSDPSCSGILTSNEIMKLDLNCELVVLSCCNTACGKVTNDGVLGLSRSLMCSGATNLIVTLWPIHDSATSVLMVHFYQHYIEHRDAPAALRQAMLFLITQNYNIAHWAPFCNIGLILI
jgi:CHAT domain-containing protein/tetratricopeptide (TPR) repeat protein